MKKIKQLFKTFFQNIKSWSWYGWVKYLFVIFLLYIGIMDSFFAFGALIFIVPALIWLIIKDYRLPHIILLIFGIYILRFSLLGWGVYFDDFPRYIDIPELIIIPTSILCIYKITIDDIRAKKLKRNKKAKSTLREPDILSIVSMVVIALHAALIAPFFLIDLSFPDYEYEVEKECIETKITKGYPKEFAREYCLGEGKGCAEKGYVENCEVGVRCCFATIEEDKKWNYLDYDKNGNRIKK